MPKKSNHGGKRPGAGRKKSKGARKSDSTAVVAVRTTKERKTRFDKLPAPVRRQKVEALIDETCPH